ncbi:putative PEP-binding protein [Leptolyngbya sp. CCNP1308]|uniref:putative PEP-binding protein n=1 Tax=Leptolyngbya sp. CCNP1308 TaxID=3110255 RepID=UPI002B209F34|nr:putative PEP-binding protein [Leptolyngbya sp. CCNP1308]MEA5450386.1 putative PEP-binding protein [Leptolyngbya sp. CCNP1308]
MTWLRQLHTLDSADLRAVGQKAYYLGWLKQQGLPVAQGCVITAAAWHHTLGQMAWPEGVGDRLAPVCQGGFKTLQQSSRQWQQNLLDRGAIAPLSSHGFEDLVPNDFVPVAWMLRASLWVEGLDSASQGQALGSLGAGLLPAQIEGDLATLPGALSQFWSQALTARCLPVWEQHCQRLGDLSLATLIMPLYPALVSGTLMLSQGQTTVAVVMGLGIALTQGEAIPARCSIAQGKVAEATWQSGVQERVYQLRPATKNHTQSAIAPPIQVLERDRPELVAPLGLDQITQLVRIAERAQLILGQTGVRLEWLLHPSADPKQPTLVITEAAPWHDPTEAAPAPGRRRSLPAGESPPPRPQPPLLPLASTVVRGIGAAAGRIQGVAVVAQRPQDLPQSLPPGCIVVLPDLQPDVFFQLPSVGGIVTERGGATCHAAILAREVGIPAVVGAPHATQLIDNGMVLWLDGDRGVVYGLTDEAAASFRPPAAPVPEPLPTDQPGRYQRLQTKVMVNLSQRQGLANLTLDHVAGIGLLRSEWLLLEALEGRHPWDWVNRSQEAELQSRLVQQLEPILQALGPRPLRYRSLDLRSHEWQALQGSPPVEPNPMLGLRGTLSYDIDDRLFQVELGALATLQRAGYSNLQLILPFVRSVEEAIACRQRVERAGLTDATGFALWIMAEVPSVLFLLPAYAQAGIQGIAIGSNDLTQLLLAIDRDQPTMASAYDERHPVVRLAMAHLVQEARRCGLLCSICGQAPVRHPELIADLVGWGINSISVEAAALPFTLEAIWQAENGGGSEEEGGSGLGR